MYNQEIIYRLGHGLWIRQLKLGRTTIRIVRPLETVIGDGRLKPLTRRLRSRLRNRLRSRYRMFN